MNANGPLLSATKTHLVVSTRLMLRTLAMFAAVGVVLAVIGVRDAYAKVGGAHTAAGTVLTVATVVAITGVIGAVIFSQVLRHQATPRNPT